MGILTDKINELNRLEEQYKQERDRIELAIADTVRSIGQNPAIKSIGRRMFTIPVSELTNSPWLPEFHDWTIQAEQLLSILSKKPVREWLNFIQQLIEKNSRNGWAGITVDKTLLNKKFLKQVIARL